MLRIAVMLHSNILHFVTSLWTALVTWRCYITVLCYMSVPTFTQLQLRSTCPHLFTMALHYSVTLHVCTYLKEELNRQFLYAVWEGWVQVSTQKAMIGVQCIAQRAILRYKFWINSNFWKPKKIQLYIRTKNEFVNVEEGGRVGSSPSRGDGPQ